MSKKAENSKKTGDSYFQNHKSCGEGRNRYKTLLEQMKEFLKFHQFIHRA